MKFEDLKVGMRVHDHVGNEYRVLELVEHDPDGYTVKLECLIFNRIVGIGYDSNVGFAGKHFWIQNSREQLLSHENPTAQQILQALGYEFPNAAVRGRVCIPMLDSFGVVHEFWVHDKAAFENFELTVNELVLMPELSVHDLCIGMKLVDANNDGFVLVGYDDKVVHLAHMIPVSNLRTEYVPALVRAELQDGKLLGFVPAED